jgi:hypothetical protein
MALQIKAIAESMAGITVSGVRVFGLDAIPETVAARDCPCLIPEPLDFVSGLAVQRDTFGTAAQGKKTVQYVLSWRFLYMPVGASRTGLDRYGDMVEKAFQVLDALITLDATTEAVELLPVEALEFGAVPAPDGGQFQGCLMRVRVTEFVN